ncbi:hypothetical protein SCHPADRAFT_229305 [Schizopora paradoxa]|uniref:Uncharacterized protein n=1 Tax=Schizopora paradoxa TaxID=27342 RepID=A0A0H2RWA3_9AGAM|nr:hypothetical protein SCHPADRAFT_229305 [Schizopora paradoxa]
MAVLSSTTYPPLVAPHRASLSAGQTRSRLPRRYPGDSSFPVVDAEGGSYEPTTLRGRCGHPEHGDQGTNDDHHRLAPINPFHLLDSRLRPHHVLPPSRHRPQPHHPDPLRHHPCDPGPNTLGSAGRQSHPLSGGGASHKLFPTLELPHKPTDVLVLAVVFQSRWLKKGGSFHPLGFHQVYSRVDLEAVLTVCELVVRTIGVPPMLRGLKQRLKMFQD